MVIRTYLHPIIKGYDPKHKKLFQTSKVDLWSMSTQGSELLYMTYLYYRAPYGIILAR